MAVIVVLLVVAAIVLMGLFLLWVPIELRMQYKHLQEDDSGCIEVRYLYGAIHIKRELKELHAKFTKEGPALAQSSDGTGGDVQGDVSTSEVASSFSRIHPLWEFIQASRKIMLRAARRTEVRQLDLQSRIGLGDAVATAVAVGASYTLLEYLFGMVSFHCQMKRRPYCNVQPVFNRTLLHLQVEGIIRIRTGYAIIAGIRLFQAWKRRT